MLALTEMSTCSVMFWAKTAVNDAFYSKLKFKFYFLFRFLLEWEWLINDNNRWYCISRSCWVENLQL